MEEDSVSCLFSFCGTASQRKNTERAGHFPQVFDKGRLFSGGCVLLNRTHTNFLRPGRHADMSGALERSEQLTSCAHLCYFLRLNKSEPLLLNLVEPARAQQPCLFEKYTPVLG